MKLAIIIGVSNYKFDTYPNLPACKNDAELFNLVLNDVKAIDDALYINDNSTCYEIKNKMTSFVEKHKESDINEFVFYFSGHGERFDEDFHYLCYDFDRVKKSTTSISNSYLDSLIRNLSPSLCVKIVDACFSGTHYIKSASSQASELESSAKKNKINDLYFLFSSREDKESEAGDEFSYFSESLFTSLLDRLGEFKYSDVISYMADDLENRGAPKPIFISQATYLESLGVVTENTQSIINEKFGLNDVSEEVEQKTQSESSFAELVRVKSEQFYCDKETAQTNLNEFYNCLTASNWPDDILSVFELEFEHDSEKYLPNGKAIGEWINENKDLKLFCSVDTERKEYQVQEYVELPSKPSKSPFSENRFFRNDVQRLLASYHGKTEKEYKLETVKKNKEVIVGFDYNYNNDFDKNIIKLTFKPKYDAVEQAVLYIVFLYSKSKLCVHFSYEMLSNTDWGVISSPKCHNWKNKMLNMRNTVIIKNFADTIVNEVSTWLVDETKKNLKDL